VLALSGLIAKAAATTQQRGVLVLVFDLILFTLCHFVFVCLYHLFAPLFVSNHVHTT
jgi:hypothetical protein